jgi:mono/diheme cytochrome c family protein
MQSRHEEFEKLPGLRADMEILNKMAQELKVGEQKEPTNVALGMVASWTDDEKIRYVGKRLFKHYGCFGCHTIDAYADATPIGTELTEWGSKLIARLEFNHAPIEHTRFDFAYTKMVNPRVYDLGMPRKDLPFERLRMPRFGFTPEEAKDLSTFLVGLVSDPVPEQSLFDPDRRQAELVRGRQVVRQYNCQGCHMIEGEGADIWPVIAQDKWKPPDLLGQGRKTNPEWLFKFMKDPVFIEIRGEKGTDRIRPWHSIRMPSFGLTDEESRAVVRYFSALSRVPSDFESTAPDGLVDDESAVGYPKRLKIVDPKDKTREISVTVNNRLEEAGAIFQQYQCKSCHSSDESIPIGNRAPNFRLTRGGRLREAWIETWLWNPAKLQAGTAMPAFFITQSAGQTVPKAQDEQFFGGVADIQIQALRDYIRHHYTEED